MAVTTNGNLPLRCASFNSAIYSLYSPNLAKSQKNVLDLAFANARIGCLPATRKMRKRMKNCTPQSGVWNCARRVNMAGRDWERVGVK